MKSFKNIFSRLFDNYVFQFINQFKNVGTCLAVQAFCPTFAA